jgi:sigma-B regulation protein RsbU (phosphoserine phosphatase)
MVAGVTSLGDLLAKLNMLVYDATPSNRFATLFICAYNPDSRALRYASAGHNPALLYQASRDAARWLRARGVGLGLRRVSEYQESEVALQSGDCLVLYTDGVTEARNPQQEEFGDERLAALVRACASRDAAGVIEEIFTAVAEFAGTAAQHDDITVIVARAK